MQVDRPTRGQTQEDLLREEQLFAKGRFGPASIRSDSLVRSNGATTSKKIIDINAVESAKKTTIPEEDNRAAGVVLGNLVVERMPALTSLPVLQKGQAFPEVFKASLGTTAAEDELPPGGKRRSLFARAMGLKSQRAPQLQEVQQVDWGASSRILDGSQLLDPKDVTAIHEENVARLKVMSRKEMEGHLQGLTPETVAFLKSRAKLPKIKVATEVLSIQSPQQNVAEELPKLKYVHMNRPEPEKMEWTGELAPVVEEKTSGFSARFNFRGELMAYSEQVPTTAGLHHHGEEQERAGYTVEELLILARSSNLQQRVISFDVLAKILKNYKSGSFDGVLEQNLLSELLDHDLVLVIRTSLDENSETLREATCYCLKQLVDNHYDELLLDFNYFFGLGHVQPSLPTSIVSDRNARAEYVKDRDQLSDADIIKLDVVTGLLRVDVLQRFAYILTKVQPTPSCIVNIVLIVVRMARHSLQSASEILDHAGFMSAIHNLLDQSLSTKDSNGKITRVCLKLLRVLAGWSRFIAKTILTRCNLGSLLPKFFTQETGTVALTLEAFRIWDTFLRYGILTEVYLDLFPVLTKYFLAIRHQVDITNPSIDSSSSHDLCNFEVAVALIKCVEAVFCCQLQGLGGLEWRHLKDFHCMLEDILNHLTRAKFDEGTESRQKARLLSSCFDVFNSSLLSLAKSEEVTLVVDKASTFFNICLGPFLDSALMTDTLKMCSVKSGLLSEQKDGRERDPKNLPSCGSVALQGELHEQSPFNLLSALVGLLTTLIELNKDMEHGRLAKWFSQPALIQFLRAVACKSSSFGLAFCWLVGDEILFVSRLLVIEDRVRAAVLEEDIKWLLCNKLLVSLQTRHGKYARTIFSIMVNQLDHESISKRASRLKLSDVSHSEISEALDKALSNLLAIKTMYEAFFPREQPSLISMLETITERNGGEALLPNDWKYLPLVQIFNRAETEKSECADDVPRARLCLQWVFLDLWHQSSLQGFEVSLHYSRLSTVFLATSALFLDPTVNKYLLLCFDELCKKQHNAVNFSFAQAVPGIDSFREFYRRLVDEYNSVSYGDLVFSLAILLPTARNLDLRTVFWIDNADNLRTFRMDRRALPASFDISNFIIKEEGPDMLSAYVRALLGNSITEKMNPLLFEIAASNIACNSSASVVSMAKEKLKEVGIHV